MASNPVVILTGASKGLGLATLEILLKSKANVVALSRTQSPEVQALVAQHPDQLVVHLGDVAKDEDNKAAVDLALSSFNRLDSLILNAGTLFPIGTTESLKGKLDEYKKLFDINFFSLVSIVSHAIPHLRAASSLQPDAVAKVGRVVMVSSGASTGGVAAWGAYSASKAAMNSFVRTLGNEESSIISVAIRPGMVDTTMQKSVRELGAEHMKPNELTKFTTAYASGTLVPPHAAGGVIAGLALAAPASLSGTFVSWDQEDLKEFARS
ncbi:short-chain dehydrogenase [Meredithblackwellia eburnea MCA 4105]